MEDFFYLLQLSFFLFHVLILSSSQSEYEKTFTITKYYLKYMLKTSKLPLRTNIEQLEKWWYQYINTGVTTYSPLSSRLGASHAKWGNENYPTP